MNFLLEGLEIALVGVALFLVRGQDITLLWYLGGLYLFLMGLLLLQGGGSIWVGFLWVIDLGVGIIFFIFILHFTNFLTQKTYRRLDVMVGGVLGLGGCAIVYFVFGVETRGNLVVGSWFLTWYDYYSFAEAILLSDLHIIREIYFGTSSVEFILINLMLLYGIWIAISILFSASLFQYGLGGTNYNAREWGRRVGGVYLMRQQNILTQQNQMTDLRVWVKGGFSRKRRID